MGKADLPGSCKVAQCGGKGTGKCYCDALCVQYGDCCSNAKKVCDLGGAECGKDSDCQDAFCGSDGEGSGVCKPWGQIGDLCGGFVAPQYLTKCHPDLKCVHTEQTYDVPGTCQPKSCNPNMICGQAITCVNGSWYPTTCGPANCNKPMGPCPTVNPPPPPAPTCEGHCGGPAEAKACYCDAACTNLGDCCADYKQLCL